MKVLISADMEGITGVTCPDDVDYGTTRWESARHLMMSDVNAAVEGFFDAGASEVVVNDAHATKRNLILSDLDGRASAIIGMHKEYGMMQGVEKTDVVALVGYHTGAGRQGILSHTYIGRMISDVTLNGEYCSEGRMNALLAAEFSVPVVLVTGDDLTCDESVTWAPHAQRVAVKECIDRYTARCLPPSRTSQMIKDAAKATLGDLAAAERPQGPFTYEVSFDAVHPVMACRTIPGVERSGDRSITFTMPTMAGAIRCFKAVSSLTAASSELDYG